MSHSFAQCFELNVRIRGLEEQLKSFRTGAAYQNLRNKFQTELNEKKRINTELREEVERLKKELDRNRLNWLEVNEDLLAEKEKVEQQKNLEIEAERTKREEAELKLKETEDELIKERKARQAIQSELEQARNQIAVLEAKKHKNSQNSSMSSGLNPNHPPIKNSRKKTGLKPGGQPNHVPHPRTMREPDVVIDVPTDPKFLDPNLYQETGNIRPKQLVFAHLEVEVVEFRAKEFRNLQTGQRVTSDFPFGLKDDVTYDGSVKALAYVLNNVCNVSIRKTSDFLREASGGKIALSAGFISNLNHSFSRLSEEERKAAFKALSTAPVFNVDFTFGRCNGTNKTVTIVCTEEDALYVLKDHKGKEGIAGTPAEINQGICISDHESVFIGLGSLHQECLSHVGRYAEGSVENEPNLKWNSMMRDWAYDTIKYRSSVPAGEKLDPVKVAELIDRFYQALEQGKKDYAIPPEKGAYREGYNLWKRISEHPEDYTLTLRDERVAPTNNLAERLGRKHKRKIKAVMAFRSEETYSMYCDGLTVIEAFRKEEESLIHLCAEVFNRDLDNYGEYIKELESKIHII